jgi:hypothetical protein
MTTTTTSSTATTRSSYTNPLTIEVPKITPFKLPREFLAKYVGREEPFGYDGFGSLVYRRTYSRHIESLNRTETWAETVCRVVECVYTIHRGQDTSAPWNDEKGLRSACEMYDKIFNLKFTPPGRGLWAATPEILSTKGHAALNNCGFTTTGKIDVEFSRPFCFLMDMSMLGVGIGFDVEGAGKVMINDPGLVKTYLNHEHAEQLMANIASIENSINYNYSIIGSRILDLSNDYAALLEADENAFANNETPKPRHTPHCFEPHYYQHLIKLGMLKDDPEDIQILTGHINKICSIAYMVSQEVKMIKSRQTDDNKAVIADEITTIHTDLGRELYDIVDDLHDYMIKSVSTDIDNCFDEITWLNTLTPYTDFYRVPDTREGWVEATGLVIDSFIRPNQQHILIDYSDIRAAGVKLKTFGGVSAGASPLIDLHIMIKRIMRKSYGKPITREIIVDIFNLEGKAVVAGNVRRCLSAGTLVHTTEGLVAIEHIVPGMKVVDAGGEHLITNVYPQGGLPCLTVYTTDGDVVCTGDHRLKVVMSEVGAPYVTEYVQAKSLVPGMKLAVDRSILRGIQTTMPAPFHKVHMCEDAAWLMGMGSVSPSGTLRIGKWNANPTMIPTNYGDREVIERVYRTLARYFNAGLDSMVMTDTFYLTPTLTNWFDSIRSRVCQSILRGNDNIRRSYLEGVLLAADKALEPNHLNIIVATHTLDVDDAFILDLYALASSLGIKIHINQVEVDMPHYKLYLGARLGDYRSDNTHDFQFTEVIDVSTTYIPRLTYDIAVETVEEFAIAGGIISHNSSEIALGPPTADFMDLKNYELHPERVAWGWNSNNSVICKVGDKYDEIAKRIVNNGEPGVFWLENAQQYSRMGHHPKDFRDHDALGTNPSLRAGTRVLTSAGIFNIEALVNTNFWVRNLNGDMSQAKCFLSGRDKPLYAVTLNTGHTYYATAEHEWPVLVNGGDRHYFVKMRTSGLSSGDTFVSYRLNELFPGYLGGYLEGKQLAEDVLAGKVTVLPGDFWTVSSEQYRQGFIYNILLPTSDSSEYTYTSTNHKLATDISDLLGFYGMLHGISVSETYAYTYTTIRCDRAVYTADAKHLESFKVTVVSAMLTNICEDVYDITVNDTTHCFRLAQCVTGNCSEQTLCDKELCCLVEVYLNRHETREEFLRTLKFAYLYAKTVTLGRCHWKETDEIIKKNRRIGTSLTGVAQFLAKHSMDEYKMWLEQGYDTIKYWDTIYSSWFKVPMSRKITTIKPSGCVDPSTIVKTDHGDISVAEIFKMSGYDYMDYPANTWLEPKIPIAVTNRYGEQETISKLYVNGYNGDMIEIILDNGTVIKCTPEHKFLLTTGEWREAARLAPDDDIAELSPMFTTKCQV